jgi:hypothetical protein
MNDTLEAMKAMASLFRKKAAVMKALEGGMAKTGTNDHFNYKFITASAIKQTVSQLLADNGISLQMSGMATENAVTIVEKKNFKTGEVERKETPILRIQFKISLCDVDTGAVEESFWFGEAGATDDKAASKAATSALKYYLISNFMIADKDEDKRDTDNGPRKRPQQSPTPQAAQPVMPTASDPKPDMLRFADTERFTNFVQWAKDTHDMTRDDVLSALYEIDGASFKEAPAKRAMRAVAEWVSKNKRHAS